MEGALGCSLAAAPKTLPTAEPAAGWAPQQGWQGGSLLVRIQWGSLIERGDGDARRITASSSPLTDAAPRQDDEVIPAKSTPHPERPPVRQQP